MRPILAAAITTFVVSALSAFYVEAQNPPVSTCGTSITPPCPPTPTPGPTPIQTPNPMGGCEFRDRVDTKTSGRFIFKPRAEHFNRALVVAPRHFFPSLPRVQMWDLGGKFIERMRVKSTGRCAGHPECLFASTHLAKHRGRYYENRFAHILIKVFNPRHSELGCYYYFIRNPGRRAEFR